MPMEWVSTSELDRRRALQKNAEEDFGRVPILLGLPPTFSQRRGLCQTGYKATACNSYQWASLLPTSLIPFFPSPSHWQMFARFYKTGIDALPIFKNAFETRNHQCCNTMLYSSNLLYNEWNKNNFSHYFSKCIKLLMQWDEQCFLMK